MKIKTKKQLNLPQLIEWAWENDVRCRTFIANDKHIPGKVNFDENGMVDIQTTVGNDETFTVEVEEEIDEDTPLSMIIEIDEDSSCWVFENTTLKNIHEINCVTNTTKYYRDEDENMHIIWRDGRMIE